MLQSKKTKKHIFLSLLRMLLQKSSDHHLGCFFKKPSKNNGISTTSDSTGFLAEFLVAINSIASSTASPCYPRGSSEAPEFPHQVSTRNARPWVWIDPCRTGNIYLQLVDFYGKCREIYHTSGRMK